MVRKQKKSLLCIIILILLILSMPQVMQPAKADKGYAKVYVICLSNVGGWLVDNPSRVKDGATWALSPSEAYRIPPVHPKYGKTPPFYSVTYEVVTNWATYKSIIESCKEVIVLNCHGEILPIPSGYSETAWVDKIAEAMLHRGVSWVHIAGYPFYRVWHQGASSSQEWPSGGPFGFKNLTSHINMPNVECWPSGPETELVNLNPSADQLGRWDDINNAAYVELGRPLKASDFKEYLIMPIHGGGDYYTSAIIAFAKPGQRFDPSNQYGFGAYVHIGTRKTYKSDKVTETDKDYWRGYVGAAAAVWAEMQSFHGRGEKTTTSDCELTVFAKPVITSYWQVGETWHLWLSFGVYSCLKSKDWAGNPKVQIQEVNVNVQNVATGCTVQLREDESKNGYGSNSTMSGIFTTEQDKLIAETILFFLALVPYVGWITVIPGGILLFSDWIKLYEPQGILGPGPIVDYSYTPITSCEKIDNYWYEEFESITTIELTVPRDGRDQWSITPLRWDINVQPSSGGLAARARGGISIAAYNSYTPVPSFTATVFSEDFEDDMSGWSVGDDNPSAGYDYWGIPSYEYTGEPYYIWCAWVGNNSLNGEVPNKDVWDGSYDKDMKADLTRSIDLRPYKEAELFFELSQFVWPGDNLSVYYYTNTWEHLDTFIGNHAWQYKGPYTIPNNATRIKFEFVSNSDAYIDGGSYLDNIEIIGVLSNDAETLSDAGEVRTEATFIDVYDTLKNYAGYLEDDDWYKFAVSSSDLGNKYVQVNLNMPQNAKFFVELYDPYGNWKAGPGGPPEYGAIYYNLKSSDPQGNWTIRIYSKNGFGQYNFDIGVLPGSAGGCPFVYIWNGQEYVIDNILLPTSARSGGTDVEDFYRLEQMAVPVHQNPLFSLYSFQIREFQTEHSYLDQVKLSAVDHQPDVNIAVAQDGEILTYKNPHPPVSCTNEYGYNMLDRIQNIDQDYYQGYPDGYLLLDFGNLSIQEGAKLVMRADMEHVKDSIHVQILNETGEWQAVAKIIPRAYWATEIVNLAPYLPNSTDNIQIRLYFTSFHKLDYVGLDTTPQAEVTIRQSLLISAIHSEKGLITLKLLCDDQIYAELTPNQQINLLFALPRKQDQTATTTFIFYTNGHYNAIK